MSSGFSGLRFGLNGLAGRFQGFSLAKALGIVFLFGFLVRLVPELIAFSSPIGYDTVHYAVVMKDGVVWANWGSFFTSSWLLYGLTVPLYAVTGVDPFVLLKVVAPALYGLSVAGVYWFGRVLLRWDVKMCLVAAGVFAFSFAALRISWDLLRNTLGMGLLLFCLPLVSRLDSRRGFAGFMVLSLLTVFAHEYATVTWVFVVLGLLVWQGIKVRFTLGSVRLFLASLPALAVFAVGMFLRFFPVHFEGAESNLLNTGETSVGKSLFFANYFEVNNAALFFPRLKHSNPERHNKIEVFAPCGAVAGVLARTDSQLGVWKAPAGSSATLLGVQDLSVILSDAENGELNSIGINCLRKMPAAGFVVWGARTLQGDDRLVSEWKYIPVRRLALFLEESLYRGTQWVVFQPNDEILWLLIRRNVEAFMSRLFKQGAFVGMTPREAYFVKCDRETTTRDDIEKGVVNIIVGFAPLKPAEFIIIKVRQMAGQPNE